MLTLALGIGANTTIFSVINNTLLKPLPFPAADRLVLVWETFGKGPDNWNIVSAPNFWDFERQSRSFESHGHLRFRRQGLQPLAPRAIRRRRNRSRGCASRRASFPCWA